MKNKQFEGKLKVNHNRESCRHVALNYITRSMRSCFEVSNYLKKKEYSLQEIQETIKFMEENKFIDDRNYIENYIRCGIAKGKGMSRIKQELFKKGIDDNLIKEVYEENAEEFSGERERAMEQAIKILRMSSQPSVRNLEATFEFNETNENLGYECVTDEKTIAKIARRLTTLGYSADSVYYVIEKIKNLN